MNVGRGLRNLKTVMDALCSARTRAIVCEAWRLEQSLPHWFASEALPQLMQRLDREASVRTLNADASTIVRCADAVTMLDYFSPLGVCLRRSLVRYVLLRRAGVLVVVHFGARKNVVAGHSKIAGHAWLTLAGKPFAENPQDYQGFATIYTYPNSNSQLPTPNFQPTPQPSNLHLPTSNI